MNNFQAKYKTLIAIIVLLLITNVALLVYFISIPGHKHRGGGEKRTGGFENMLRNEVGFDKNQINRFTALRETHWARAKAQMEEMKRLKLAIFDLIKNHDQPDAEVEHLADSISHLQKQIEINSFRHFSATRQLCTPAQQPVYDSIMKKFISRTGRSGKPAQRMKK